jgi:hypothetical protein
MLKVRGEGGRALKNSPVSLSRFIGSYFSEGAGLQGRAHGLELRANVELLKLYKLNKLYELLTFLKQYSGKGSRDI